MHRIPFPGTDASLLLSPRWGELSTFWQWTLLGLIVAVPLLLVVILYRYELRLIKPAAAVLLLGLRLVVLVLILFLLGLQPIYARTHTEELPGRVLVAVDRSDSTGVTDPQRPPVEKLRLALALKVAGDVCPDSLLQDWIKQYDDTGDIRHWVAENELADDAPKRRQVEAERREKFAAVCARVDGLTRAEIARRVLAEDGAGLLAAIGAKHKVEVIGFTQEAWDVKPDAVADLFKPAQGDQGRAPDSSFTDLRLPLARALERSGAGEGKVLGVVLLSDGQHNWGMSPVKKAIEMGEHKLPIYAVPLGAHQAPPDVAVVSVKAPAAVFKDVDTQIEARLKVSGIKERKQLVVQLQRPGQDPLEETIDHDGSDRYHTVRFQLRLDKAGTQALTIVAKPLEGETTTDNNRRSVVINVADDKARVLLIDGEARWEQHYLANALARDRTIQPQSVVFLQPRLGQVSEDELRKAGNPWRSLPNEPDALSAYDCIILGDVAPEQLPLPERVRLEKYVGDRGGTLVVLAGKRSMPLGFGGADAGGAEGDPLLRLLPIEQPQVVRPTEGFPVTLTYEGKNTPFLQMEPEPDKNEQRWSEFPRHYWGVVGKVKPGGTPLAYVTDGAGGGKKEEADRAKERGLIVRHNYGFGRVLFVGIDSTWRWRYRTGDTYHHRFWGQAIRWAAADKPLVTGNEFVRFGTRDAVYRHGQDVDLVVRLAEEAGPLAPDAIAAARILRLKDGKDGEESVALVPLGRREAQARVLEGKLRDLPAGHYAVELVVPDLGDKLNGPAADGQPAKKLRATFSVTPPDGEEMVELATNYPLLEELAAKSGGQVFAAENTAGLVEALTKRAVTREDRAENRLWQWWVTLVLVLSLLTVEWVGRKLAGLP
ncbi:MAG TPA: hypothetical protein VKA46_39260 [Gemmataceae bacterium]|nr:hypothetical protein [Gemmataceae bacterium]